jgi:hypothetical protein
VVRNFPEPDLTGQYLPNLTRWHGGVTQDHAGPFCTMGLRIARGFCASRDNLLGVPARQALGRSSGKTNSNERKEWKPIHRGLISSSDGGPHLRIGRYKGTCGECDFAIASAGFLNATRLGRILFRSVGVGPVSGHPGSGSPLVERRGRVLDAGPVADVGRHSSDCESTGLTTEPYS